MKKKYRFKSILYLSIIWGVSLLVLSLTVILLLLKIGEINTTTFSIIGLLAVVILIFILKPKIDYYSMQYKYLNLLDLNVGIVNFKSKDILNSISSYLLANQYNKEVVKTNYLIFTKINKSITRNGIFATRMIEIITIFKVDLDFYDSTLDTDYANIWGKYEKKEKLNKQVIIQFKRFANIEEKEKQEINKVICYRERDNYLITINCGLDLDNSKAYFLHSLSYYPNMYYKYGALQISKLLELE